MRPRRSAAEAVARATSRQPAARTRRASTKRCGSRKPSRPGTEAPPPRERPEMRVLALDLGSKRVGVAISDRSGTIASPLTVLQRSGRTSLDHERIRDLVVEEEAVLVV